jgi:methyl-accepting chemotaxis protein
MQEKHSRKPKTLLINPAFQLKVVGYFLGLCLVNGAIFLGTIIIFFRKFETYGVALELPENHIFYTLLRNQRDVMLGLSAVTLCVSLLILALAGLYLSHRIAGPIHRLKGHLLLISQNNSPLEKVHFRKNDEFHDLQDAFNKLVESRHKS